MRNLKKILAMVLALVMSLSLMATAGAAQFPDVDDSNPYKTAIDVLDELKVFQGFEDGTFKPTDTLNRAQAAVLVYRIATGDVENKYLDNYTYMQQSKFNDLDGYNWAKGYINYCQNAQIVVGTSATTFDPGAPVTGYQLMVMLLRTLGYGKAGEFTDPKGWELQTSTIAEREGLLKNVVSGDFGAPAQRQMVAEILFRGILHDTVEYSPLTPGGYTDSGVSLGKKTLGLDDIEGVVVANRIADLYDTEPMKDGQTRMIVDGKDYVIDMDTDASAIGLNHHAYVQNGKVLGSSLEAEGNVIGEPEHGEAAKVADLAKGAGIKTNADTDYYVNFDEVVSDTSNYRLEYLIGLEMTEAEAASLVARNGGSAWIDDSTANYKFDRASEKGFYIDKDGDLIGTNGIDEDGTTPKNFLYDKVIPAKETISSTDSRYMKEIFVWSDSKGGDTTSDDLFFGEVYVGTKSKLEEDDISDDISHDEFIEKYINVNENRTISSSDNGEWLRVIDNNGDGVAEYVLRTDFIMTTVVDYEKRTDLYNVEYDVDENHKIISKIPAGEIRMDDGVDMSVGAVILYTYIDGYYYISNPEVKTLKVDTKSIEQKKNIFKSDDVEYTWSGIDKEAELYYTDISEISYDVNYDMYFDHFGFVRLATEARRNFVLLTDGYFKTDLRNHEWKVELYNGSEKVETADVVDGARNDSDWDNRRDDGYDGKIDGFIDTFEDDHQGNRGTWKRLNTFGEFYQQLDTTNNTVHYKDKNYKDAAGNTYTDGSLTVGRTTYYQDPFTTNIALASETDGVWTLQDVTDIDSEFNSLYRDYRVYELAGTDKAYDDGDSRIKQRSLKAKSTDLWGIEGNNVDRATRDTGWDNNAIDNLQAIQTNGSTLYYYVDGDGKVTSWVGYRNLPEGLENFAPARAYAVTHKVWADRDTDDTLDYEIADVVVFENNYSADVYDPQLITTGINTKRENALGKDSDGEYTEHGVAFGLFDRDELLARAENAVDREGLWTPQLNFYASNVNKGEAPITENFAKYGIYAGQVIVADETKHNDYIEIGARDLNGDRISFYTDDVAAYEINRISKLGDEAAHNLEVETNNNIRLGDRLIVVLAGDDVKMVVNVSASGVDGKNLRNDGVPINKLVALYSSINNEWANPAAAKVTVKFVDDTADHNLVETWKLDADKNGQLFLPAADLALGGNTIVSVKNEAGTAIAMTNEAGVNGYLLTGISKDTTVTVTLTVDTNNKVSLSLSGFSLSGADLQSAVKNNALTNYTAGTDLTGLTYGDAYKFVLKTLNNTQYKYELIPDTTEAEMSWNAAGTELTITGTVNAATTALTLTRSANDSTDIKIGTRTGADVTILTKDNTGAAPAKNADATVLRGQAVTFKVELTTPATSKIGKVTYTIQNKDAVTVEADENGNYTIPVDAVKQGLPITIDVEVKSTAPINVTFTGAKVAVAQMSKDNLTWVPAADTTVEPDGVLYLSLSEDVPTPTADAGATVEVITAKRVFKVSGITTTTQITINAAAGITALTGASIDGTDGSITNPTATGTLKYALVDDNPATDIATITELNNTEANVNTVLGVTLGAVPTLTGADAGKFLVFADVDSNNVVGIVAVEVQLDPAGTITAPTINNDGTFTPPTAGSGASLKYALVADEPDTSVVNVLDKATDVEGDLECTLGNAPTLSAADNSKWLIIVEIDDTSEQVTKICKVEVSGINP